MARLDRYKDKSMIKIQKKSYLKHIIYTNLALNVLIIAYLIYRG